MIKTPLLAATTLASLLLALSPAHALLNRAWVSGHGTDAAGCGAPTSPCRTFQYVHDDIIAAGGEIDVLDPAGYGAVTITKAVSIVNDGVGTAGVQAASGNAITINAGASDLVTLRGLNIDGLGTGANGIVFNSGGGLTVVNCVIRHFVGSGAGGNGVLIQPTSGSANFLISNVIASDNGFVGIYFVPPSGSPSATAVIKDVTAVNNQYGIALGLGNGSLKVSLSDSAASNNAVSGVVFQLIGGGSMVASVDNSHMDNNAYGLVASGALTVRLGRSVITSNSVYGVNNATPSNTLYTYEDNRINDNGTDVSVALTPVSPR